MSFVTYAAVLVHTFFLGIIFEGTLVTSADEKTIDHLRVISLLGAFSIIGAAVGYLEASARQVEGGFSKVTGKIGLTVFWLFFAFYFGAACVAETLRGEHIWTAVGASFGFAVGSIFTALVTYFFFPRPRDHEGMPTAW